MTQSIERFDTNAIKYAIQRQNAKNTIIKIFNQNVKGKGVFLAKNHDGSEGHRLEKMFNLKTNSRNEPDILGFELKKESQKVTFGDFSATEYLYNKNKPILICINGRDINISRERFIEIFGTKNPKNNRFSWSGKNFPKLGVWNDRGQTIKVDEENIVIYYDYQLDKLKAFPSERPMAIAFWSADGPKSIKAKVENKFGKNGFVIVNIVDGVYHSLKFGRKITYSKFLELFKERRIILDSGMHEGNSRNYSHFRAYKNIWNQLCESKFLK